MGLFSKLKDYNLELEEILDNKYFSSKVRCVLISGISVKKNVLYSLIYSIYILKNILLMLSRILLYSFLRDFIIIPPNIRIQDNYKNKNFLLVLSCA